MTLTPLRPARLALAIALLMSLTEAMAAANLYLDISGLPGGSVDDGHRDQIDLQAFSWGANVAIGRNAAGQRTVGQPSIQDISWAPVSSLPSALPLFGHITTGAVVPKANFQIVDAGATRNSPWLQLTADESLVTAWSISGSNALFGQASINTARLSLAVDVPSPVGTAQPLVTNFNTITGELTGPKARDPASGPATAPPAAGLYLRLGSGITRIAGDNTSHGHEHWIAIDSYSTSTALSSGVVAGATPGKPSFTELAWSQRLDATAPVVLRNLLDGLNIGQAALERVIRANDGRAVTVMQLALTDVIFSSMQIDATPGGGGMMAGSLSFGSYSQTNWVLGADGSRIGPFSVGYDLDRGARINGTLADVVTGFGAGNLDGTELFNPSPIPEPQTWTLLLAGLAGVLVMAQRRGATRP